jgi:hypothetical protein
MNPILRQIADYISGHKDRSTIDPLEIEPTLLPHLYILEIQKHAEQVRLLIRLSGTALDRAFGRGIKGHYLEEFLHGGHSAEVLKGFHDCARDRTPRWMRQVVEITNRPPRYVEGVAFYVTPGLIYGGLVLGEISGQSSAASFEIAAL